ncbi:MAG: S8 family serine peptidase, partial [Natronosporangium sp.]
MRLLAATPHVSGAAAILAQQRPDLAGEQLKALLMSTAVDLRNRPTEQGSGRLDVSRAIDPSVFVAGSGAFGRQQFPHQAVTRNLTYHNVTDAPVTLTLTGSVSGPDGAPAPDGLLTLSQTEITVPAGGSTPVSAVLDGSLLGGAGPFGEYRGSIDAVDSGGELRSRTLVRAFLEPERFPVTLQVVPPDGASDLSAERWLGIPVDDQTELHGAGIPLVQNFRTELFPGSYSFISQAITWRDPDGWLNQALVTAPEVTVTDGPVTVRLDLRELEPVEVRTPEPTESYQSMLHLQRASVNEDWATGSSIRPGDTTEPTRLWTKPTGPVTLGRFEFRSSHVLVPPMISMVTFGRDAATIHPRYGTADVTAPAGTYAWTEGETE